jgi:hypothetical protein
VGDGFDELLLGHAFLNGSAEVEAELCGVAAGGEHGHAGEAAVTGGWGGRQATKTHEYRKEWLYDKKE